MLGSPRTSPSGTERILRQEDLSRFSLLNEVNELDPSGRQYLVYWDKTRLLSAIHQEIIEFARVDGFDIREGTAFIDEWVCFIRNWGDLTPQCVLGFLNPRHMMFWAALRRGWAHWRPSDSCSYEIREYLLTKTQLRHRIQTAEDWPSNSTAHESYQRLINQSHLPRDERMRLDPSYYPADISPDRMFTVWVNWNNIAASVEERRLPDEVDFTVSQLRLDRLERLIREEIFLNEGLTTEIIPIDSTATDIVDDNISWLTLAHGTELDDGFIGDDEDEDEVDVEMVDWWNRYI
jgi:hypothetical protein